MQRGRDALALALAIGAAAPATAAAAKATAAANCAWLDPVAAAKFSSIAADCAWLDPGPASSGDGDPATSPPAALLAAPPALPSSIGVRFAAAAPARPVLRSMARPLPTRFAVPSDLVGAVAARHRIDPLLLGAIIARESAGRPGAVSPKGARGLMQVMPATGRALGVRDPRDLADPAVNLVAGATYLKQMQARFGNDLALTLAAYNAGPGAVARHRGVPPYAETRAYVANILGRYAAARQGAR